MPKAIQEIIQEVEELTQYHEVKTPNGTVVSQFKNPDAILEYFQKIIDNGLFKPTMKESFPSNLKNIDETFNYFKENYDLANTHSLIGEHAKYAEDKQPNKSVFIFDETAHFCDPHGDFQSSVEFTKALCDEYGCLKKDITLLGHGDYIDRGAKSIETLLFFLKLKEEYVDQVQLLRGNHEVRNIFSQYGYWQYLFPSRTSILNTLGDLFNQLPISALVMPINEEGKMTSCTFASHGGPLYFEDNCNPNIDDILGAKANIDSSENSLLWNELLENASLPMFFAPEEGYVHPRRGAGSLIGSKTKKIHSDRGIDRYVSGHSHINQTTDDFFENLMISGYPESEDACEGYQHGREIGISCSDGSFKRYKMNNGTLELIKTTKKILKENNVTPLRAEAENEIPQKESENKVAEGLSDLDAIIADAERRERENRPLIYKENRKTIGCGCCTIL